MVSKTILEKSLNSGKKLVWGEGMYLFDSHASELTSNVITEITKAWD